MKEINEVIKKITPEDTKYLASRLPLSKKTKKDIITAVTSIGGLHALLGSLDTDTLRVCKTVYEHREGITFVDIQRELKLDLAVIEKACETLSRCLLIYVTKNRQMLTTKMDKAHGIVEIAGQIHLSEPKAITDRLHKNFLHLEAQKIDAAFEHLGQDKNARDLLKRIASAGCILTLGSALETISARTAEQVISNLIAANMVHLVHGIMPEFNSYLILNERAAPLAAQWASLDDPVRPRVKNRYFLVHNLLLAFDVISTFGLFLTKQLEFRKIDLKRIADAMIPLRDLNGMELSPEETAQLAMYLLSRMGCLKMNKDIAAVSLAEIRADIERPLAILKRALKAINDEGHIDPNFKPPFDLPSYDYCRTVVKLLTKMKETSYRYFQITVLTGILSEKDKSSFSEAIMSTVLEAERFDTAMNLLCIAGVVDIDEGKISLSDIGRGMAGLMLKTYAPDGPAEEKPVIYVNPDFTLLIPTHDVSSETLYRILSYTDITKNDIIINAAISRASVVKALKRGMSAKLLIETLASFAKNQMPQNLSFLLQEWSDRTVNVSISHAIVLKASHPSFLDELTAVIAIEGAVQRISPHHAIVRKEHLDDIVKFARRKDAVISLFSQIDEED